MQTAGTDGEWRVRAGMFWILQFPVCFPLGDGGGVHPTQISTAQLSLHREAGLLAHSGAVEALQKTYLPLLR